ncbi:MAG: hypothetical protein P9X24_16660 [Candidatus Hatepunaea meridiana]|nr:hypothetical protein [Candidatus Hatepunaea meridiana]
MSVTMVIPTAKTREELFPIVKKIVLDKIRKEGHISRKEVEGILECGSTFAWNILRQMVESNLIQRARSGRNSIYTLN